MEEDFLERLAIGSVDVTRPQLIEYGVTAEQNEKLGLPCGGRLVVLVQQLKSGDLDWLASLNAALASRECTIRTLDLKTGATSLRPIDRFTPLAYTGSQLQHCLGPQMRMLLVGAGQLARTLAELALAMDYEVLVTDPRQTLLDQWQGPEVALLQGMPDDIVVAEAADRFSIIITLTHDPRIDDMALMVALETEAWYVGALGSLRTTEKRRQRLRALGLSEPALGRLHAPVGLPIGSKTPVEIAVAIMAEITSLRHRSSG